jgi:hypothetical protein
MPNSNNLPFQPPFGCWSPVSSCRCFQFQTPRLSLFGYLIGMTEIDAAPILIPLWYDLSTPVASPGLLTPAFEALCWKSLHTPNPPSIAWRFLESNGLFLPFLFLPGGHVPLQPPSFGACILACAFLLTCLSLYQHLNSSMTQQTVVLYLQQIKRSFGSVAIKLVLIIEL